MKSLPASALDRRRTASIAEALVKWARSIPADGRTSQQYLSTVQFAQSLASELPEARSKQLLSDLRELRVFTFFITTLREQMRYDTPRLIVEAGKPFEITLLNTDLMPHNLVIVKPGQRERIGKAAMKLKADVLDGEGRAFLPSDGDILAGTKLLENDQRETLKLTAPAQEGDYEYLCTYPDHWQVMWGRLIVTKDVDEYLRTHRGIVESPAPHAGSHVH